jgi:hypothetical protein
VNGKSKKIIPSGFIASRGRVNGKSKEIIPSGFIASRGDVILARPVVRHTFWIYIFSLGENILTVKYPED